MMPTSLPTSSSLTAVNLTSPTATSTTASAAAVVTSTHSTSVEDHDLLMHPGGYMASAVVLFFIGFFGFFLNLFVIIIMCRDKQLWTPLNIILFNLVCSDFSVSILGNPFTLASSVAHHWLFGPVMCVIYGFFMSLLGITSITTLTVLSFERYLMVSRPLKAQQHITRRGAILTIAGIWLYSMALTIPPLVGWGEYINEAANISCSINWESRTYGSTTYILFLFTFGLVVPVSIISFSYLNIIKTMKRQQKSLRMGRVNKAETRVTIMVAVMIIAFLIAWTPYAALALIIQFGDPSIVSPAMAVVPALVAKSSICYNPVIYVGLNTQFRSSWRCLFGLKQCTAARSTTIETTNNQIMRNASKIVSVTSLDDSDERRKQLANFMVFSTPNSNRVNNSDRNSNVKCSKTSQLLQLFPNTATNNCLKTPAKNSLAVSYTNTPATKSRKLTVFQDQNVTETFIVKDSTSLELIY